MRLEDYLSCVLNETKWYSFSRTNFDELTELCRVFSKSEGQAGALGNCRLVAQGVATSCKAFTFKGQTHGLGTPISTYIQLPSTTYISTFFSTYHGHLGIVWGKETMFVLRKIISCWKLEVSLCQAVPSQILQNVCVLPHRKLSSLPSSESARWRSPGRPALLRHD